MKEKVANALVTFSFIERFSHQKVTPSPHADDLSEGRGNFRSDLTMHLLRDYGKVARSWRPSALLNIVDRPATSPFGKVAPPQNGMRPFALGSSSAKMF